MVALQIEITYLRRVLFKRYTTKVEFFLSRKRKAVS